MWLHVTWEKSVLYPYRVEEDVSKFLNPVLYVYTFNYAHSDPDLVKFNQILSYHNIYHAMNLIYIEILNISFNGPKCRVLPDS